MFDGSDWLSYSIIGRIRENLSVGGFLGDGEKGQKGKSHKIQIGCEKVSNAVLSANGCDLCIEGQVSPGIARFEQTGIDFVVSASGRQDPDDGTSKKPGQRSRRLFKAGRRVENSWMRRDTHELAQTKYGNSPRSASLGEMKEPFEGFLMEGKFLTVGIDQDIRVDGDQEGESMRSMSDLRSDRSIPGRREPFTTIHSILKGVTLFSDSCSKNSLKDSSMISLRVCPVSAALFFAVFIRVSSMSIVVLMHLIILLIHKYVNDLFCSIFLCFWI